MRALAPLCDDRQGCCDSTTRRGRPRAAAIVAWLSKFKLPPFVCICNWQGKLVDGGNKKSRRAWTLDTQGAVSPRGVEIPRKASQRPPCEAQFGGRKDSTLAYSAGNVGDLSIVRRKTC